MTTSVAENVLPGFNAPTLDAQRVFRLILEAMTYPGRMLALPAKIAATPDSLHPAAAAISLTLLDNDTPVWTDLPASSPALAWLRFHCGCPLTGDRGQAAFGLIAEARRATALDKFFPGTDEAPETAATLIMQVEALYPDRGCRLSGPGIKDRKALEVSGLANEFWQTREKICRAYPIGLDMIFVCDNHLAALPRTTIVNG